MGRAGSGHDGDRHRPYLHRGLRTQPRLLRRGAGAGPSRRRPGTGDPAAGQPGRGGGGAGGPRGGNPGP
ncbi:hypothetical protein FU658_00935 [Alkalisalibacterium limincola]|uniref:Uncharacterized protein n=1 Tax=Alkalisalibacterium limincola TaxID=2699169 RepID=A0A5C8KY35_9GAMM|nr:hypothetical protein FU658_00935 [Alkalisalibacterium limincola]